MAEHARSANSSRHCRRHADVHHISRGRTGSNRAKEGTEVSPSPSTLSEDGFGLLRIRPVFPAGAAAAFEALGRPRASGHSAVHPASAVPHRWISTGRPLPRARPAARRPVNTVHGAVREGLASQRRPPRTAADPQDIMADRLSKTTHRSIDSCQHNHCVECSHQKPQLRNPHACRLHNNSVEAAVVKTSKGARRRERSSGSIAEPAGIYGPSR
jgi:hypothetical protein